MTTLKYAIHCKLSGLQIGVLEYQVVAGHMPYLSHWDNMTALHPVFSLPRGKLLAFARGEWNRLAKAAADELTTDAENNMLRVCFLAVLHSLESIRQDAPSLPSLAIVQSNMQSLFKLAYWHYYLDSKRFSFPEFKINAANKNTKFDNLHHYIDACFAIKDDYDNGVNEAVEKEKIAAADRALRALRNSWITPTSNKELWRWVAAHMPAKYSADVSGWMSTLFLGSDKQVLNYLGDDQQGKEEIELLEQMILAECPPGTAILSAVRQRIDYIYKLYTDNKEAFSVDFADYEDSEPLAALRAASKAPESIVAPRPQDFASKVDYIKANAFFYLQQRAQAAKAGEAKVPLLNDPKKLPPVEDAPF